MLTLPIAKEESSYKINWRTRLKSTWLLFCSFLFLLNPQLLLNCVPSSWEVNEILRNTLKEITTTVIGLSPSSKHEDVTWRYNTKISICHWVGSRIKPAILSSLERKLHRAQVWPLPKPGSGKDKTITSIFYSSTSTPLDPAEFGWNLVFVVENTPMKHTAWTSQRVNSFTLLSFLHSWMKLWNGGIILNFSIAQLWFSQNNAQSKR